MALDDFERKLILRVESKRRIDHDLLEEREKLLQIGQGVGWTDVLAERSRDLHRTVALAATDAGLGGFKVEDLSFGDEGIGVTIHNTQHPNLHTYWLVYNATREQLGDNEFSPQRVSDAVKIALAKGKRG